jgi:hypothetical protein
LYLIKTHNAAALNLSVQVREESETVPAATEEENWSLTFVIEEQDPVVVATATVTTWANIRRV